MNDPIELSYGRFFGLLRRGLLAALLLGALTAAVIYIWSSRLPPSFAAQAVAYVSANGFDASGYGLPDVSVRPLHVTAYRVAAASDLVLGLALNTVGQDASPAAVDSLRRRTVLSSDDRANLVYIGVTASSPQLAADQANAVASQLVAWDQQRAEEGLERVITVLEQRNSNLTDANQLEQVNDQLGAAKSLRNHIDGNLQLLRAAAPPLTSSAPTPVFNALLAALLMVVLVYAVVFLRELFDPRLYTVDEMAQSTNLPLLGAMPRVSRNHGYSADLAELLSDSLAVVAGAEGPQVVQVCGAASHDRSSAVATALAENYACNGERTLLIDSDLQAPELTRRFRLTGAQPLTLSEVLSGRGAGRKPSLVGTSCSQPLHVLFERSSGPKATELLTRALPREIGTWRSEYDRVVIRSAAWDLASDAALIGTMVDGTVLVSEARRGRKRSLLSAIGSIQRRGGRLFGLVVTQVGEGDLFTLPANDGAVSPTLSTVRT